MRISSGFEGGSIGVVDAARPDDVQLTLLTDNAAEFYQWFFFRVTGARDQDLALSLVNAGGSNANKGLLGMPDPWPGYEMMASYDLDSWFRVPTQFDGRVVTARLRPAVDSIYFANFPPYSLERHRRLIGRAGLSPHAALEVLGQTPDGHDLDLLRIGEPGDGRKRCWITARQHPGEPQGSWCVDGLVERLLDLEDALSRTLLAKAVFYVVPTMNPDGVRRGNTRTNALGANLNRQWVAPALDTAPEVALVKRRMEETGVDFFLDVHAWAGDHNFALGPYRIPSITAQQTALWARYEAALAAAAPDFDPGRPYPGGGPKPGKADLGMAWNYVSEAHGALGVLYELLYKDNAGRPDPGRGWTPGKCRRFGAATLNALAAVVDDL